MCHGNSREAGVYGPDALNLAKTPIIGSLFEYDAIYETGRNNPDLGETVKNFDSGTAYDGSPIQGRPSLYTLSDNNNIVKECYLEGVGDKIKDIFGAGNEAYTNTCINVNPIMDNTNPNYCYRGQSSMEMTAASGVLNLGLPLGAAALCTVVAPGIGTTICGTLGGILGGITYAYLQTNSMWPHHSSDISSEDMCRLTVAGAVYATAGPVGGVAGAKYGDDVCDAVGLT